MKKLVNLSVLLGSAASICLSAGPVVAGPESAPRLQIAADYQSPDQQREYDRHHQSTPRSGGSHGPGGAGSGPGTGGYRSSGGSAPGSFSGGHGPSGGGSPGSFGTAHGPSGGSSRGSFGATHGPSGGGSPGSFGTTHGPSGGGPGSFGTTHRPSGGGSPGSFGSTRGPSGGGAPGTAIWGRGSGPGPGERDRDHGRGDHGTGGYDRDHGGPGGYDRDRGYGDHKPGGNEHHGDHDRYDWGAYRPGHRPPEWEHYRHQLDPKAYAHSRRAEHRYHGHPYAWPNGWHYRRWSYGDYLPGVLWARQYWLNDYWRFGLFNPPYGYVWVRYGNDVLLIDVENGRVLSIVNDLFD